MKRCFKCLQEKPLSDFYAHPRMKDGRLNKCKACTRKDVSAYKAGNIDLVREKDRERGGKKSRPLRKAMNKIARANRRPDEKLQRACHEIVSRALLSGELIKRPCERCGSENSEAHHESYLQPLIVSWLCRGHHKRRHREMADLGLVP